MSKYTTELRYFETEYYISMQDYPIINTEYREELNDKIFNNYYFHEIGFETPARFNHYLKSTMENIMPYYNKLLQTELLSINPLLSFERNTTSNKTTENKKEEELNSTINQNINNTINQNINNTTSLDNVTNSVTDETQTKTVDLTQNNNINSDKNVDGNNSSSDEDIFYDTPNGSLGDITDSTYATTVNKKTGGNIIDESEVLNSAENIVKDEDSINVIDNDTVNTTVTDTLSETDNETINTTDNDTINNSDNITVNNLNETNVITENGFEVPLSELLLKYRETFLNVDLQIINELKDLFMMIY